MEIKIILENNHWNLMFNGQEYYMQMNNNKELKKRLITILLVLFGLKKPKNK
jgi:predicted membrane protein